MLKDVVHRNPVRTARPHSFEVLGLATTVIEAFNEFMNRSVNLDPETSARARSSRDWLVKQIAAFPNTRSSFPLLMESFNIHMGSFARRTKVRPLDDIDMITGLHAQGCAYEVSTHSIRIGLNPQSIGLPDLCFENENYLNSRRVLNRFKAALMDIPQYESAAIRADHEAVSIKLKSYDWNFDVVPGFMTTADALGRSFYLIPDGSGNWKKTDPRRDRDRVSEINKRHNGNVLDVIRIMKYWNRRRTMPSARSYMFENLVLNYYSDQGRLPACQYIDWEVERILEYLTSQIWRAVPDPAGIQSDLNSLGFEDRVKIAARAHRDLAEAREALQFESARNHKESMTHWAAVFGPEFPTYG